LLGGEDGEAEEGGEEGDDVGEHIDDLKSQLQMIQQVL